LLTNGLKKGDRILISCKINAEAILLSWACFEMGIILVPISIKHNAEKVHQIMEDVQAKMCFFDDASYSTFQVNKEKINIVIFDGSTAVEAVPSFSDWLEDANDDSLKNTFTVDTKDVAVIIYTSGSTGLPKGVQLTQGNLYRSGQTIANQFNWNPTDVFFSYGGLETMSGFRNATIAPLFNGTSIAIPGVNAMSNLFALIDAIQESQSTIFSCNPALLGQLVKHETIVSGKLQHIKTLMCTGNVLSEKLREQVQNKFNLPILNYYGATETSGICIAQTLEDTTCADGNIGSAIDCIAQIVDANNNTVPIGEKGELRVYSNNLMKGYINDAALTQETIQNGWYYTKDIGSYSKEGNIILHGRTREIIKTPNEEIVYIKEIQEIINQLDFIEDALITSFIQNESEKIVMFVVVKPHNSKTEQELNNEIRIYIKHTMGEYALPGKIIFVDKLPYNENGKLNNELIHAAI
jgi:acyl-coenzyme A synthetase/AMP-(fatty) acid ligase